MAHLPQEPRLDDLAAGLDKVGRAPPLRADLHDAAEPAGSGEDRLAFEHIDADRLLEVDISPRLHGSDPVKGVPVVGGADEHDVELVRSEHVPIVAVGPRGRPRLLSLLRDLDGAGKLVAIGVGDGRDLDRGHLHKPPEVAFAIPAGADQPDPPGLSDGGRPSLTEEAERKRPRSRAE